MPGGSGADQKPGPAGPPGKFAFPGHYTLGFPILLSGKLFLRKLDQKKKLPKIYAYAGYSSGLNFYL